MAALAGYGASVVLSRFADRRYAEFGITTLVVALVAIEYAAVPAANIAPVPVGDAIPPYVHWLAQQPHGVVLELPMMASRPGEELDLTTQYLSTYHWQATPDGYSGFNPPRRGEIAYEMESFPNERSVALLQALGVDYVLVHSGEFSDWSALEAAIHQTSDLAPVAQWGSDYAFRVVPRALDASQLSAAVYLPEPAAPGQNYFAYLIVRNKGERDYAVKPTTLLQIEAEWSSGLGERVDASIPIVTSSVSVVQAQLRAPPQAGTYRLHLHVTSGETGEWDLYGDVDVEAGEPAHQVVLPASVKLGEPLEASLSPGGTLPVALEWKALNKIDAYYSASVRLVDSQGNKVAQQDREPVVKTLLWKPGTTISDRFMVTLPNDLAAGKYSVQVLMYQADQHVDALLLDDQFAPIATETLGTVTVD
jgi:methionine-rich copper-binding protein CopC